MTEHANCKISTGKRGKSRIISYDEIPNWVKIAFERAADKQEGREG